MEARPIAVHMNPLHPHGDNKKIRTHKWKTSHTVMARTFYNYRKNERGFIPPVSDIHSRISTVTRIRLALDANSFAIAIMGMHGSGANAFFPSWNTTHPYVVCLTLSARMKSRVSEMPVG
jgi:hypothetical protein